MTAFTWQGEFSAKAHERRYRLTCWRQQAMRTRLVCGVSALLYLAIAGGDYLTLTAGGVPDTLPILLPLRIACFILGWLCVLLTFPRRFMQMLPWGVGLYILSLCTVEAVACVTTIDAAQASPDPNRMLFTLLLILAFYIFLPIRLLPVLAGASLGSSVFVMALGTLTPLPLPQVYTTAMFFIMVNVFGGYYLRGANITQRNNFYAQREERLLKRRLRRETAERRKAQAQLQLLATTDDLTGIYNRRQFLLSCQEELARFRRYGLPATVLLIDVDHFHRINDKYGHETGDKTLQALTTRFVNQLRSTDIVGRLGGEEFGVLLPGTEGMDALAVARKLCKILVSRPLMVGDNGSQSPFQIPLSLSIGVVTMGSATNAPVDLLHYADIALVRAKQKVGDRVHLHEAEESDTPNDQDQALASA